MTSIVHFLIVEPLTAILLFRGGAAAPTEAPTDVLGESPSDPHLQDHLSPEPEPDPSALTDDSGSRPPEPPWKSALFRFATPINICAILGVIWSATRWSMPAFLSTFVVDLEKSIVASGLFAAGIFVAEGGFTGPDRVIGTVSVLSHVVVVPVVSGMWSWVLHTDREIAAALVLVHAAPMAWECVTDARDAGLRQQSPGFSFLWGNALSVPVFMGWLAVLRATSWLR
jgi:predicted permease